ncbi:hypothetical protein [Paenibacillus thalictri]|uniref:Uncharacterized protein n=1 Tax=Paenibacillus thalictri TaxID=2527873 RepID=A0A4Q9DZN5_9BACL|nr:hypothetical protein [Paenibacillus thalictri]TBL81610.1 hypothetical protein EYB31_00985 [Paenibacillus thalictri]
MPKKEKRPFANSEERMQSYEYAYCWESAGSLSGTSPSRSSEIREPSRQSPHIQWFPLLPCPSVLPQLPQVIIKFPSIVRTDMVVLLE